MEITVTFTIEADDPKHDTGVTEETYIKISDAVMTLGGYDLTLDK